jgi:hypothetical protein
MLLCSDFPGFYLLFLLYDNITQKFLTPLGFETATPATDRPQTLALDRWDRQLSCRGSLGYERRMKIQ